VLKRWESSPTHVYAETLVAGAITNTPINSADRALLNALVLGVIRNRTLLDQWIDSLLKDGGKRLKPGIRNLLRTGLFQLLIQGVAPHAAVNETVSLAPKPFRALTNAVMRRAGRERSELLEKATSAPWHIRYSHPSFLIDRWRDTFGNADTEALLQWNNTPAEVFVRENPLVPGDSSVIAPPITLPPFLADTPVIFHRANPSENSWLQAGLGYVQDPSTALAPTLIAPEKGARVLDACAAPGGKTSFLAQLMDNSGEIVATDLRPPRIGTLEKNLNRLGVTNTRTLEHDWAAAPHPDLGTFDAVLADVPCSNSGVLRRRVDARWRMEEQTFTRMQLLQSAILTHLAPHVKTGGRLVYSTCSIDGEENAQTIKKFCTNHPGFALEDTRVCLPWRDGFDGAFAALLVRRS